MIRDDAIEELRERRRKLFKENYGNSLDRLFGLMHGKKSIRKLLEPTLEFIAYS